MDELLQAAEFNAEQDARRVAGMDDDNEQCPECKDGEMIVFDQGNRQGFFWCYSKCSDCGHKIERDNFD